MELTKYFDTTFTDSHLNNAELYELMGYGIHTPDQYILDSIAQMMAYLKVHCRPHLGYMICPGERVDKENVKVKDIVLETGGIIATAMKEADYIAVFTVTLGSEFDKWLHDFRKDDNMVDEFIANTLGSVLAEGMVEELKAHLEKDMAEYDMSISNNYSPGYCNWALVEQRKLFSILPQGISQISLTDSCLMLPIKSVSGIIAVGKDVKKRAYRCSICTMTNCVRNMKKAAV